MDKNEIDFLLDKVADAIGLGELKKLSESQKQEILEDCNKILSADPLNVGGYFWRGMFFEQNKNYDSAIADYEQVLRLGADKDYLDVAKDGIERCLEMKSLNRKRSSHTSPSYSFMDKISVWFIVAVKIIILVTLAIVFMQPLIFSGNDKKVFDENAKVSTEDNLEKIYVNSPSEYNYLTKREVYNIRKKYVGRSLFNSEGYEPSEQVFGQIVDNKAWWGLLSCGKYNYKGDYHERIEGDSKVSVQMNNPDALVGISLAYLPWEEYTDGFCGEDYSKFIPTSLKYDRKNNLIIAKYYLKSEYLDITTNVDGKSTRIPVQLSGLNALDFGYKYVWVFDSKNIKMQQKEDTVVDDVKTFNDFIHLGGSCRFEDGCNNISPMQSDKMFTVTGFPAEINIKLWKKQPHNKYQKADFYYKIIFEKL